MTPESMAELMVKLERDCEEAQRANAPQFTIKSEWQGEMTINLTEMNELNVHFNRRYPEYAITLIGNSGIIDKSGTDGTVIILIGHMVLDCGLPDMFHQIYMAAPPHLK